MNANHLVSRQAQGAFGASLQSFTEVGAEMFRIPMTRVASVRNSGTGAWLANGVFCLSVWISLLAAIWLSRGWIGLFFSGQVLSAGGYVVQRLFKRTRYAFCTNNGSSPEFEIQRHGGE
jgi:hypothetical protein